MSAPDPILDAIAAALHGDNCPDDPDEGCVCDCDWGHWERQAQVAYAAGRPLIEAEVRERVAREIEALRPYEDGRISKGLALAIARGDA